MNITLLCIASGQTLANLIPVLQLKPAKVLILATPAMQNQASLLKSTLENREIITQINHFADKDIETLEAESLRIAGLLKGEKVVFNATGGTKQIALMLNKALQALDSNDYSVIYADTARQSIDWLISPENKKSEIMQDMLSLEDILGAQGFRLHEAKNRQEEWVNKVEERALLTAELGDKADRLARFFGALNGLAQRSMKGGQFAPRQELAYEPEKRYAVLLKEAQRHELLEWDGATAITFASEDAARYFGGGWLEEYVFFRLRGCCAKNYAINAILIASDGKTSNEIDALAVHRNRLLAIECKTLRFGRDAGKDADLMYKLDSLSQRAGGLMQGRMLLSARPLDDLSAARARELKIEVIASKDIRTFPDRVRAWMNC